jgi:hypothetical protein
VHAAGSDLERRFNRYWETFRQKDDPKTFLGPAVREQFATVILAWVSAGTWQRFVPMAGPVPMFSVYPGRVHVVQDGSAHQTQALLLTDAEAADWLTATAAGEI